MAIEALPVEAGPETGGVHHHPEIDWRAAAESPEFHELSTRRRRFVVPATAFFLSWYVGFVLLCGYAPGFMGTELTDGLTLGYVLALSQFLMVWGLTWAYLRFSRNVLDPLAEKAAARAIVVSKKGGAA